MNRNSILIGLLLSVGLGEAFGQGFSFELVMRAGRPNSGDWQIGAGNPTTGQNNTGFFAYDSTPPLFWNDAGSQNFRMGWDATTNRAYTTVYNENGVGTTVSIQNTGTPLTANATWTLPANGFWASATPLGGNPGSTSILLAGLSFSPGVNLRSGTLPASFGAAQSGGGAFSQNSAPIVLDAASNGGSWYIAGTVQFTGLVTQGGTAANSRLQFHLNALGNDTPEPESLALLGGGLVALAIVHRARRNRTGK